MKKVFIILNGSLGEEEQEPQQEQQFLVTESKLQEMIDAALAKKGDSTKDIVEALKIFAKSNQSQNGQFDLAPVFESVIDPDDYLEVPAVFFAFCVSTTIWDDIRYGKPVKPKYGEIKFKTAIRTVKAVGNRIPQYTSISTVILYSKSQAEFVRKHSLFEIMYFEKIGDAKVSSDDADALSRASNIVNTLNEHEVRSRAINSGMRITTQDPDVLKRDLIKFMAEGIKKADATARKERLKDLNDQFGEKPEAGVGSEQRQGQIAT